MFDGTIIRLNLQKGFGFIGAPGKPDIFFHCADLAPDLLFDEQLRERRVKFSTVPSDKGPRAIGIRPTA